MYDIMARDQICETRIYAARTPELDRRCTGELPKTEYLGVKLAINLKGQMKQAPVDATSSH